MSKDALRTDASEISKRLSGLKTMVVDDDPIFQKLVAHILQRRKMKVSVLGNAKDALGVLKEEKFDLVISDVYMPELDGIDFLRQLRGFSKIPVILTSAFDDSKTVPEAKSLGVRSFLPKPFKEIDLITCVFEAIESDPTQTPEINASRFRNEKDGVKKLAIIMEQAEPAMRKKIVDELKIQDPQFAGAVVEAVLDFEKLERFDEMSMGEIIAVIPEKVLAYALSGVSKEFREAWTKHLGASQQRKLRDCEDEMGTPQDGLVQGARRQIVKIVRQLEAKGKLELP